MNLEDELGPTLLILHGLLSAGADCSEKTIDTAIAGAVLLATKLEAPKPKREKKSKESTEETSNPPATA